jgi:hypothetical protein
MNRPQTIEGFTLFQHYGKGWQMSVRRKGEAGWDVNIVTEEQAEAVLSMLERSGHPDGPWTVRDASVEEELWYLRRAVRKLTEVVTVLETTL